MNKLTIHNTLSGIKGTGGRTPLKPEPLSQVITTNDIIFQQQPPRTGYDSLLILFLWLPIKTCEFISFSISHKENLCIGHTTTKLSCVDLLNYSVKIINTPILPLRFSVNFSSIISWHNNIIYFLDKSHCIYLNDECQFNHMITE